MNPGLIVKLRPTGPWRIGPDSGARNRVDVIYHSDSLYSAVTSAMASLGSLEEWLEATARRAEGPAVRFSSCFPFVDDVGYVVPPRTLWPPVSQGQAGGRVRWRSARFVPLGIVQALLNGQALDDNHWTVDGASECLMPQSAPGPFRTGVRWNAAVDRVTGASERHSAACIEFREGAGLWTVVAFADEAAHAQWSGPVKAAFRVLADSGFGGERSRGWGRAGQPEFVEGTLPDLVLSAKPKAEPATPTPNPQSPTPASEASPTPASEASPAPASEASPAPVPQWLLSLFTPAAADGVDWSRGNYAVVSRGGRIESPAASGGLKKQVSMVSEGSVLYAAEALRGAASDVAPDGFAHPVFRAGFAVSIPLPGEVA